MGHDKKDFPNIYLTGTVARWDARRWDARKRDKNQPNILFTEWGWLVNGEGNVVGWDVDRRRWNAIRIRIFLKYLYDGVDRIRMKGDELRIRIFTVSE
jgi:hypothetical protein